MLGSTPYSAIDFCMIMGTSLCICFTEYFSEQNSKLFLITPAHQNYIQVEQLLSPEQLI